MSLHVAVAGWLLDGSPSGANRRLLALLRALPPLLAAGERLTVLHGAAFTPPFAAPGLAFAPVAIPARPTWRRVLAERRTLPRLLAELGVDVLDHGFLPAPAVPCRLCLLVHDARDADGYGSRPRWLGRLALRRALARADAVVVPSAFTAGRLRRYVPSPPPIHVVGHAAAMSAAAPPADAGSYVLHVGHLEPRKNLELLLHALALLPARARPQLRFAGADAGSGARLRRCAERLGVDASVRWLGAVPDDALPGLYAGARAVAVPSRYEGFGLCAAEGLAAGRPVLVADAGALPELAGATVLPVDDAAAWAAAIATPPPPPARRQAADDLAMNTLQVWRSLRAQPTSCMTR